jgi:hypothetical protein
MPEPSANRGWRIWANRHLEGRYGEPDQARAERLQAAARLTRRQIARIDQQATPKALNKALKAAGGDFLLGLARELADAAGAEA